MNQQDATLAALCLLTTTSMLYMFRMPFSSIIGSTFWPWNSTVLTDLDIYTGFIPSQLMTNTSDCCYSL